MNYNPKATSPENIISILQQKGYLVDAKAANNSRSFHSAAAKVGQIAGKAVLGAFVQEALGDTALSFLALLL